MSFLASMAGGIGAGMQQTGDMFAKKALVEAQAARDESLMRLGIQLREESEERMDARQWERTQERAPIIAEMETDALISKNKSLIAQIPGLSEDDSRRLLTSMLTGVDLFAPGDREKWTTEDRKYWNEIYGEEIEAIEATDPGWVRTKFHKITGKGTGPVSDEHKHQIAKALADQRFDMWGRDRKPGSGDTQRIPAVPKPEAIKALTAALVEEAGGREAAITAAHQIEDPAVSAAVLKELGVVVSVEEEEPAGVGREGFVSESPFAGLDSEVGTVGPIGGGTALDTPLTRKERTTLRQLEQAFNQGWKTEEEYKREREQILRGRKE